MDREEAKKHVPVVVHVDEKNKITSIEGTERN
jgi:aspartate 1-decarboxylase